tara:strand:- start:385 stop:1158 length:774 start_codon:yes stop_codon:yes gene_type:complete
VEAKLAKKVKLEIGEELFEFKTQKAAKDFFTKILYKYPKKAVIDDERDHLALMALIQNHPESQTKIGNGIASFYIDDAMMGTRCFHINRVDGSFTDFSLGSAITGRGDTLFDEIKEACREAVRPAIRRAKEKYFKEYANEDGKIRCELSGELISRDEANCDHKDLLAFHNLVTTWVAGYELSKGIKITRDMLSPPKDNQYITTFINQDAKENWVKYHHRLVNEKGSMRIVKQRENLKRATSAKITASKNPLYLHEPE